MSDKLVIRGVPRSIALDAWWFGEGEPLRRQAPASGDTPRIPARYPHLASLAAILVLGDALFWKAAPGISLVVFAWAVFAIAAMLAPSAERIRPALLLLAASLPAIDYAQVLSVVVLAAGLLCAVAQLHRPRGASASDLMGDALHMLRGIPRDAMSDALIAAKRAMETRPNGYAPQAIRSWAFPIGGALILAALMARANPVLADWLASVAQLHPDWEEIFLRGLLWAGLAMLVWPILAPPRSRPAAILSRDRRATLETLGLNGRSVARALVVYNLVLAVQMGIDMRILVGDGGLPAGITYAQYARQGAYPLLAATVLGGAFALAARPLLGGRPVLRALLFVWLLQNVLLCGTAMFRLAMYVDAYGFTYLRVHAMIWMAVIAAGLGLTALQVHLGRSNGWLLTRAAGLGLVVLYTSAFVNFADVIARKNLTREAPVDWEYLLEDLPGPQLATVHAAAAARGCPRGLCARAKAAHDPIADWREWGFRRWRVDRRMARAEQAETSE
ncbi:MAG: DUF4173 domain-containing protein [Pseudomonadota bacterium]